MSGGSSSTLVAAASMAQSTPVASANFAVPAAAPQLTLGAVVAVSSAVAVTAVVAYKTGELIVKAVIQSMANTENPGSSENLKLMHPPA